VTAPAPPPPSEPASPGRALRIGGIVAGAVGVVALGNGVRLSLRVHDLNGRIHAGDSTGVAEGNAASRDQWISYGVGAAALVGGGILYYLGVRQADGDGPGVAVTPLPGGVMALARGHF
jgi:hypothetical protein